MAPGGDPEQRLGELGLPVALDAGDTDDLAAGDLEIKIVDHHVPLGAATETPSSTSRGARPGRCRLLVHPQADRSTDHQLGQLRLGVGGLRRADDLAAADHRDLVGDRPDLTQLVGDEDDRLPSSRSERITSISSSISCGVSTAVGSSKIRYFASLASALRISTRCCTPTGRSSTSASGSTVEP